MIETIYLQTGAPLVEETENTFQSRKLAFLKWRVLLLLSLATLLAMATWFSASAVVPALTEAWGLNASGQAWLTMSVQVGFVAGSLLSALLNMADRISSRFLFTISALLAAVCTAVIGVSVYSLGPAIILRLITGAFLAGVYPVGMKITATWTRADRGLGIGLLVGALTLGSAAPHLLNSLGSTHTWQQVLLWSAGISAAGAIIALLFVREGPLRVSSPRFNWKYSLDIFKARELRLANLGYLGHMWELYAMWAWIASFLLGSFQVKGISSSTASLSAFAVIGAGGLGSLLAGKLADRWGRTMITILSMLISGCCALIVGFIYGSNPALVIAVCLVWGFAIVADSAQFSAAISELCHKEYTGTALTIQTSLGFLLTMVSIRLIPTLQAWLGWRWSFAFLALGPAFGIWAMVMLRRTPQAVKLAGGRR
jgi:MFS family permease